ncbi:hypothetical protein OPQ81_003540 [Rhizoctonia solani]|nr:hypothetical protein OPQ81_003540 [Rhizoctonia solani]
MASYTLTAVQEGQEALLIDSGVPGEYEDRDVTNQMGPEEGKEDGTTGGDNGGQVLQAGTSVGFDFQDDPPIPADDQPAHRYLGRHPKDDYTSDGAKTSPTSHGIANLGNVNNSLSNNGALGNHAPLASGAGRVPQLSRTSSSPFPSSSRASTPQAPRTLPSGAPSMTVEGRATQSKTTAQRPLVTRPDDPLGSETAAASVGI